MVCLVIQATYRLEVCSHLYKSPMQWIALVLVTEFLQLVGDYIALFPGSSLGISHYSLNQARFYLIWSIVYLAVQVGSALLEICRHQQLRTRPLHSNDDNYPCFSTSRDNCRITQCTYLLDRWTGTFYSSHTLVLHMQVYCLKDAIITIK